MTKTEVSDDLIRSIAEKAAKKALEAYIDGRKKESQRRIDKRFRDTKFLLKNYRQLKLHVEEAVDSLSKLAYEDFEFFEALLQRGDVQKGYKICVEAIIQSKAKSTIMLTHIETMIRAYKRSCNGSRRPEEQRRYRVMEAMCLLDEPLPAAEIAEQECVDIRTIYKDFDSACETMSALLFGVQWIDRD